MVNFFSRGPSAAQAATSSTSGGPSILPAHTTTPVELNVDKVAKIHQTHFTGRNARRGRTTANNAALIPPAVTNRRGQQQQQQRDLLAGGNTTNPARDNTTFATTPSPRDVESDKKAFQEILKLFTTTTILPQLLITATKDPRGPGQQQFFQFIEQLTELTRWFGNYAFAATRVEGRLAIAALVNFRKVVFQACSREMNSAAGGEVNNNAGEQPAGAGDVNMDQAGMNAGNNATNATTLARAKPTTASYLLPPAVQYLYQISFIASAQLARLALKQNMPNIVSDHIEREAPNKFTALCGMSLMSSGRNANNLAAEQPTNTFVHAVDYFLYHYYAGNCYLLLKNFERAEVMFRHLMQSCQLSSGMLSGRLGGGNNGKSFFSDSGFSPSSFYNRGMIGGSSGTKDGKNASNGNANATNSKSGAIRKTSKKQSASSSLFQTAGSLFGFGGSSGSTKNTTSNNPETTTGVRSKRNDGSGGPAPDVPPGAAVNSPFSVGHLAEDALLKFWLLQLVNLDFRLLFSKFLSERKQFMADRKANKIAGAAAASSDDKSKKRKRKAKAAKATTVASASANSSTGSVLVDTFYQKAAKRGAKQAAADMVVNNNSSSAGIMKSSSFSSSSSSKGKKKKKEPEQLHLSLIPHMKISIGNSISKNPNLLWMLKIVYGTTNNTGNTNGAKGNNAGGSGNKQNKDRGAPGGPPPYGGTYGLRDHEEESFKQQSWYSGMMGRSAARFGSGAAGAQSTSIREKNDRRNRDWSPTGNSRDRPDSAREKGRGKRGTGNNSTRMGPPGVPGSTSGGQGAGSSAAGNNNVDGTSTQQQQEGNNATKGDGSSSSSLSTINFYQKLEELFEYPWEIEQLCHMIFAKYCDHFHKLIRVVHGIPKALTVILEALIEKSRTFVCYLLAFIYESCSVRIHVARKIAIVGRRFKGIQNSVRFVLKANESLCGAGEEENNGSSAGENGKLAAKNSVLKSSPGTDLRDVNKNSKKGTGSSSSLFPSAITNLFSRGGGSAGSGQQLQQDERNQEATGSAAASSSSSSAVAPAAPGGEPEQPEQAGNKDSPGSSKNSNSPGKKQQIGNNQQMIFADGRMSTPPRRNFEKRNVRVPEEEVMQNENEGARRVVDEEDVGNDEELLDSSDGNNDNEDLQNGENYDNLEDEDDDMGVVVEQDEPPIAATASGASDMTANPSLVHPANSALQPEGEMMNIVDPMEVDTGMLNNTNSNSSLSEDNAQGRNGADGGTSSRPGPRNSRAKSGKRMRDAENATGKGEAAARRRKRNQSAEEIKTLAAASGRARSGMATLSTTTRGQVLGPRRIQQRTSSLSKIKRKIKIRRVLLKKLQLKWTKQAHGFLDHLAQFEAGLSVEKDPATTTSVASMPDNSTLSDWVRLRILFNPEQIADKAVLGSKIVPPTGQQLVGCEADHENLRKQRERLGALCKELQVMLAESAVAGG
ncbi:unnamed protein product [Amoebophrya sp. A120]|nr:unnamed protein product [Amoebophrya sp. A120]|eukprot:GSA120T00015927001.1